MARRQRTKDIKGGQPVKIKERQTIQSPEGQNILKGGGEPVKIKERQKIQQPEDKGQKILKGGNP